MEWRQDIRPARTGDRDAYERLKEYLTPFVHAVCLAHAPQFLTQALVPRVLDESLGALGGIDDVDVGSYVMTLARRRAKDSVAAGRPDEVASDDVGVTEALRTVARLREISELTRERFLLRMLEGIPGPEIADVARLTPGELRAELERGAAEAARLLGHGQSFAGDDYLWELQGAPGPLLARLEMQLPVLRFDPNAVVVVPAPMLPTSSTQVIVSPDAANANTFQELKPVGGSNLGGPMRGLVFDQADETSVGDLGTEPGVVTVQPPKPAAPNPFEPQVRTIAATDLPAEARGSIPQPQVPWNEPQSSKSGKMQPLPPRPVPDVKASGESSSKSISNKSGRQKVIVGGEQSGKKSASSVMPGPVEVTKDAPVLLGDDMPDVTAMRVPSAIVRNQGPMIGQTAGSGPQSMLGRPTMEMALGSAVPSVIPGSPGVATGETRLTPFAVEEEETRAEPPPTLLDAALLKGTSPFFIAGALVVLGLILFSAGLFATDRQAKANWALTEVVVAAQDLNMGDVITLENVALRAVPEPYTGRYVVKRDAMDSILDQKLAVSVQTGDPLFFSQFVAMRDTRGLAQRVTKKGRGYTIATNVVSSVGQWVKPSDQVDIIVTINATDPRAKTKIVNPRAVTILQHVRVLATGRIDDDLTEATVDERDKRYGDVTLLLTAQEAEVVALGAQLGRLTLTLRNPEDDDIELERERGYTAIQTLLDGERVRVLQKRRFDVIKVLRNAPTEKK